MDSILIVDDNPEMRELMVTNLQLEGRKIDEADNKDDAIDLIQRNDYDVVIVDLELIEDDPTTGISVLQKAKEKDPYTQVIVVTSYGTPQLSVNVLKLGAYDYIERGTPGKDFYYMLSYKTDKALEWRQDKLALLKYKGPPYERENV